MQTEELALALRIQQLERQVADLYARLGIEPLTPPAPGDSSTVSPAVLAYVQAGDKIRAIKQYREETGVGLAEAKHVVDQLG